MMAPAAAQEIGASEKTRTSTTNTTTALQLSNVVVRYGESGPLALRGISLKVGVGETVAVVGRTGAGKTSMLLAILKQVPLTSGRVEILGRDLRFQEADQVLKEVCVVPQFPTLFAGTLRSNLDPEADPYAAQASSSSEKPHHRHLHPSRQGRRQRAKKGIFTDTNLLAVLDFVGLLPTLGGSKESAMALLDAPLEGLSLKKETSCGAVVSASSTVKTVALSQSQKQRLCLARALLRSPKMLLIDELTATLEENDAVELVKKVKTETWNGFAPGADSGRLALLMVVHQLEVAKACASRFVALREGQVISEGVTSELIKEKLLVQA